MKWNELKELVIAEYDRRNLKSNVRYRALDKVDAFIKEERPEMMSDVHASFPSDKDTLKKAYEAYKGKQINSAESSAINGQSQPASATLGNILKKHSAEV